MDWIIVGLGNPGPSYEGHRHNIGFKMIGDLADCWSAPPLKIKKEVALTETFLEDQKILLACPQRYMNLSGEAIAPLVKKYPRARWLVIHDELDLVPGKIRFKKGGGTGGHNGLKSLHHFLGSEYERLRIGIGHPGDKNAVSSYVLSRFSPQEKALIFPEVERTISLLPELLRGKEEIFVQKLHAS